MASAILSPISLSPLAEMVPTCAISFRPLVGAEIRFSSSTTNSTALSMPRFSDIGLAPAVTDFRPSRKIACASTVAVVVPSPAISEVLVATSFTIWAPMFSIPSSSSISLATVTPSLVIVGFPNFLSMTTLRPLGPRVTFTASASWSTPRFRRERASVLNSRYLAAMYSSPAQLSLAMTSDSLIRMISSSSSSTCEPVYFPYTTRSPTFSSIGTRWPFSNRPGPTAMISPWIGFSLAVSGMYRPPFISWVSSSGRIATRSASGKTLSRVLVAVAMMLLSTRRESGPCRPPPSHSLRSGVQQRLVRRDLHLDQVRLGRLRLRQRDRQHAEVVGRLDLVGIDRGRQPERPFEGAIGPLIAMHLLGLLLGQLLLRALDRQQVALHRDLHLRGHHPGQLRHEAN